MERKFKMWLFSGLEKPGKECVDIGVVDLINYQNTDLLACL